MHSRLKFYANRCENLFKMANAIVFTDQTAPTILEWKKRSALYTEASALAAVLGDLETNLCPLLKALRACDLPPKAAAILAKVLKDFDWAKESLYDADELKKTDNNPNNSFVR